MDYSDIPHGDMPGDKIKIGEDHVRKAEHILPVLIDEIAKAEQGSLRRKVVVAIYGGSGAGKSAIASLLGYFLTQQGHKSYVMSGDNYPYRIPARNDEERLARYKQDGEEGLRAYLGSPDEIEFERVNRIIAAFKAGDEIISLKRMGRAEGEIYYEDIDFSDVEVLIVEWTHGNSDYLKGIDIPVFLHSTPEETLEHRRVRARDGNVDSPFTALVLRLEQELLESQRPNAKIVVTQAGDVSTQPGKDAPWKNTCLLR